MKDNGWKQGRESRTFMARRETVFKCILLTFLCLFIYFPVLSMYFCSDDFCFLGPFSLHDTLKCLVTRCNVSENGAGWYRITSVFLYFAEYQIWKYNALGYHLTNLILHALCTLLVYFFARVFLQRETLAFVSGILFALHPAHTEAVAWISERHTLLSALFYIAAMTAYVQYRMDKRRAYYSISLVSFMLALFSKEDAVTLPFALLCYEWIVHSGKRWRLLVPYVALLCCYIFFKIFVLRTLGGYELKPIFFEKSFPFWIKYYVLYKLKTLYLPYYAEKWVLPWYAFFLLPALPVCLWFSEKKAAFLVVFLFVSMLPYVLLLTGPHMGAWYVYIPSVSFCILLSMFLMYLVEKTRKSFRHSLITCLVVIVASFYVYAISYRLGDWMVASELCRKLPLQIKSLLPENTKGLKLYVYGLPHNYKGAYVFANCFEAALHLALQDNSVSVKHTLYSGYPTSMFGRKIEKSEHFFVFLEGNIYRIVFHPRKEHYFLLIGADGLTTEIPVSKYESLSKHGLI